MTLRVAQVCRHADAPRSHTGGRRPLRSVPVTLMNSAIRSDVLAPVFVDRVAIRAHGLQTLHLGSDAVLHIAVEEPHHVREEVRGGQRALRPVDALPALPGDLQHQIYADLDL